jgi:hypothetical protein
MNVVIVGKTRMGAVACIGALTVDSGSSLRLKPPQGEYPQNTPLEVGSIWDLDFVPATDIDPPHVEDVIVRRQRYVGIQEDLARFVLDRMHPGEGGPEELFDGLIRFTGTGHGYISERIGLPQASTGFWIPDQMLTAVGNGYFQYGNNYPRREIKYVGLAPAPTRCPASSLLRVSLARWRKPEDALDFEERCYLQLSGSISVA